MKLSSDLSREIAKNNDWGKRLKKPLPIRNDFYELARDEGILVIDGLLKPDHHAQIVEDTTGPQFPWSLSLGRVHPDDKDPYFVHKAKTPTQYIPKDKGDYEVLRESSSWVYDYIYNFVEPLGIHQCVRMQFNCNLSASKVVPDEWHTDFNYEYSKDNMLTALYYVTDSDGPTNFQGVGAVEAKANRAVVFPTRQIHAGSSHTTDDPRIVINFNYYPFAYPPIYERANNGK